MISDKERLTTQLLSCVYKDPKDSSVLRINFDNLLHTLAAFNYNLPNSKFEKALEELLNKKMYGARITPGLRYALVQLTIELADMMHVTDEQIINYYSNQVPMPEIDPNTVKNWRKEYYGSMDKHEKQALIESMQGKLRPDVIEEIKKA